MGMGGEAEVSCHDYAVCLVKRRKSPAIGGAGDVFVSFFLSSDEY